MHYTTFIHLVKSVRARKETAISRAGNRCSYQTVMLVFAEAALKLDFMHQALLKP
jgi:hypothetical protein